MRVLSPSGAVTTLAGGGLGSFGTASGFVDGPAASALFNSPGGIAPDASGGAYLCDGGNAVIRRVDLATGVATLFAGSGVSGYANGIGTQAQFSGGSTKLADLVFDAARNALYIADAGANVLRAADIATANVSLFAGGGNALSSGAADGVPGVGSFFRPTGLALNADSSQLYVADLSNNRVRVVVVATGNVTTLTGNAGGNACASSSAAQASSVGTSAPACHASPTGLAYDGTGYLYVTNAGSVSLSLQFIQRIDVATARTTFVAGTNFWQSLAGGTSAGFNPAAFGAIAWAWGSLFLATSSCITQLNVTANAEAFSAFAGAFVCPGSANCTSGNSNGMGSSARLGKSLPWLVYSTATDSLLLSDASANALRRIAAPPAATVSTIAGGGAAGASGLVDGVGTAALFNAPNALAVWANASGSVTLYVSDSANAAVRAVDVASGAVSTVAGGGGGTAPGTAAGYADGASSQAGFASPGGIAWYEATGELFVSDTLANRVRVLTLVTSAVSTLAGGASAGSAGHIDGVGTAALFYGPSSLAIDAVRRVMYIGDSLNNVVRKVSLASDATYGTVSTSAGGGTSGHQNSNSVAFTAAMGTSALFNYVNGLAMNSGANELYISAGANVVALDCGSGSARKFLGTSAAGSASDGVGTSSRFRLPAALAFDAAASKLYVSDSTNYKIRVALVSGSYLVSPVAGGASSGSADGIGTSATFGLVRSIALSSNGSVLYVGEASTIRAIALATQVVTTLIGAASAASFVNGPLAIARLGVATGLAVTASGALLLADAVFNSIRAVGLLPGAVKTVAGGGLVAGAAGYADGGGASAALFNAPQGLAVSGNGGTLWVADTGNGAIRRLQMSGGGAPAAVSTLAGASAASLLASDATAVMGYEDGANGTASRFRSPGGIADASGCGGAAPFLVVSDSGNNALRAVDLASGATRTLAAGGLRPPPSSTTGYANGAGTASLYKSPAAVIFVDAQTLVITDSGNSALRLVSSANGSSSTLLAGGSFASTPMGGAFVSATSTLYYSDVGVNRIFAINTVSGIASNFVGSGGTGTVNGAGVAATFRSPTALATDAAATTLFVCDSSNNALRTVVISTATAYTFCGGNGTNAAGGFADGLGTSAMFSNPRGIAWLSAGSAGTLIVADGGNNVLRSVDIATVAVTKFAGGGIASGTAAGWADGIGTTALFSAPCGLVVSADQTTLYVADSGTGHIRVVSLASSTVATLAGGGASGSSSLLSWDAAGSSALFALTGPVQLATDGTALFIAAQDRVRRLALAGAVSSTLSGGGTPTTSAAGASDGAGSNVGFSAPRGLSALDSAGNFFLADSGNNAVRQLRSVCGGGAVAAATVAGGAAAGALPGAGTSARFSSPLGVAILAAPAAACGGGAGLLLVADTTSNLLRNVSVA